MQAEPVDEEIEPACSGKTLLQNVTAEPLELEHDGDGHVEAWVVVVWLVPLEEDHGDARVAGQALGAPRVALEGAHDDVHGVEHVPALLALVWRVEGRQR